MVATAADTSTCSETWPSCSSRIDAYRVDAATPMFWRTKRLNPGAVTSMRYVPGGRLGALYSPELVVTSLVVAFVSRWMTERLRPPTCRARRIGDDPRDTAALALRHHR